jgi:hypothetical protein
MLGFHFKCACFKLWIFGLFNKVSSAVWAIQLPNVTEKLLGKDVKERCHGLFYCTIPEFTRRNRI